MGNSTNSRRNNKSRKPYPEFPLTAHSSGRWCKKHRGKRYYFGPLNDWQAALERYEREWPYIIQGKAPPSGDAADGCRVRELCNRFLTAKRHLLDTGEITERTFADYFKTCETIVSTFGADRLVEDLAADDFGNLRARLAEKRGPVALGNEIGRVRVVFNYAWDSSLIDRPVRYGQEFRKPSKKTLRKIRTSKGPRMFESDELRALIEEAPQPLKAMLLLGINCGLGQNDCANLPQSALDLEWLSTNFPKMPRSRLSNFLGPETEISRPSR